MITTLIWTITSTLAIFAYLLTLLWIQLNLKHVFLLMGVIAILISQNAVNTNKLEFLFLLHPQCMFVGDGQIAHIGEHVTKQRRLQGKGH